MDQTERYLAESITQSDEGAELVVPGPESINSMFKTVVGGKKKGRMYGRGLMASTFYPDDMTPNRRGGFSGANGSSQEMESMRDRLDASMRSNDELRTSVHATQQEIADLRDRVALLEQQTSRVTTLEEQVRALVAGMSQGVPAHAYAHTSGRTLFGAGSSIIERSSGAPSHLSSRRQEFSQSYVAPSQDYGYDDDDDADVDDDETQAP